MDGIPPPQNGDQEGLLAAYTFRADDPEYDDKELRYVIVKTLLERLIPFSGNESTSLEMVVERVVLPTAKRIEKYLNTGE
ncbi:MAG TPA: hypothetical protein VGK47_06310 [Nitrososphaeraceae archaeon]